MKITRRCMFETNSSSCHSFHFGGGEMVDLDFLTEEEVQSGKVFINRDYYGLENESYCDVRSKLRYLFTDISLGFYSPISFDVHQINRLNDVKRVFKEYTGCELIFDYSEDGYVDHESEGAISSMIWGNSHHHPNKKESNDKLMEFLFNTGSVVRTANDCDDY